MAARVRLTDDRIRRFACPEGKQQAFLRDSESPLRVRVTSNGAKAFVWESKVAGKTVRITIGDARAWSIPAAREAANEYQRLADKNIDPREFRRAEERQKAAAEAAQQAAEKYTLRALCAAYARHLKDAGKTKSAGAARSAFRCYVDDTATASRPAKDVTALELADLIRVPREAGKERTAGTLRAYLGAAYEAALKAPLDAALPSELVPYDVSVNPLRAIPTIPVNARNRTLSPDELARYAARLGGGGFISNVEAMAEAVLWAALLAGGQRIEQMLRATVADWNASTNTLRLFDGKGKRRNPREHLIPLANEGAAFIAGLVERSEGIQTPFIFATTNKPVHASNVGHRLTALREELMLDPFDVRDIRRTVETMLAGMGISRDVRAQLLSHGIGGVQDQFYDRHGYASEKRDALVKWEKHLLALRGKHRRNANG